MAQQIINIGSAADDGTGDVLRTALDKANSNFAQLYRPPINAQTGIAYTLVLNDAYKIIETDNAGANTVTIPNNASVAFPVGTQILISQYGAGVTTVQGDTGVTVNGASGGSVTSQGQYYGLGLYKRATDEWVVFGGA